MSGFFANGKGTANPLNQLGNREGVDRSLFKDRQVGPASSSRQASGHVQSHTTHQQIPQAHPSQPFNLSRLSAALSQPQRGDFSEDWARASQAPRHGSPPVSTFSSDFQQWSGPTQRENWAEGYDAKGKGRMPEPQNQMEQYPHQQRYQPPMQMSMGMGMGMGMGGSTFQPMYQGNMPMQQIGPAERQFDPKEQERMEAAFEQALADARAQTQTEAQSTTTTTATDDKQEEEGTREAKGDFDAVWESLRPEAERLNKLAEWENDFSQVCLPFDPKKVRRDYLMYEFTNDEDDLFETLNDSLHRDDVGQHSLDDQLDLSHFAPSEAYRNGLHGETPEEEALNSQIAQEYNEWKARDSLPENGIPQARHYDWSSGTSVNHLSPQDSWERANELLAQGGSLSEVTSLLENYLRRGRATIESHAQMPVSDVEAWSLLGRVHAMNEKEDKALAAFEAGRKALESGPGGESVAGEMLTNLAISYVNESEDLAALSTLHQFLTLLHPNQAGPAPTRTQMTESKSPWALHQTLTTSFLDLAREQYTTKGEVDPDVQVGLGTAYYMMGEYEEARKCWVAALGERPDDYLLWNRLGATLANGGNPEEAVDAYRRALELKPEFTRAIFNLGVACLNIGVHKEAAEHFLAALSMHAKMGESDAQMSDSMSIWATLRRAFVAMDMNDLAAQCHPGADLQVFKQAGFTF